MSKIWQLVDLTLLKPNIEAADIFKLYTKARLNNAAAICIYPKFLEVLKDNSDIKKAVVINFPYGVAADVADSIYSAAKLGANEIDYVFPFTKYLSGAKQIALKQARQVIELCHKLKLTIKVILEISAYDTLADIKFISNSLLQFGDIFLKTSTGFKQGANIAAAKVMLECIKEQNPQAGFKASGGIRSLATANEYLKLAEDTLQKKASPSWFRIGASNLAQNS